jgi:hypothetical protein
MKSAPPATATCPCRDGRGRSSCRWPTRKERTAAAQCCRSARVEAVGIVLYKVGDSMMRDLAPSQGAGPHLESPHPARLAQRNFRHRPPPHILAARGHRVRLRLDHQIGRAQLLRSVTTDPSSEVELCTSVAYASTVTDSDTAPRTIRNQTWPSGLPQAETVRERGW